MRTSKWTVEEWLDAVNAGQVFSPDDKSLRAKLNAGRGYKPDGDRVKVVFVEASAATEIWDSGSQIFGSGGFGAGIEYAGNEPARVSDGEVNRTSFMEEGSSIYRLTAPCVVYSHSSDHVGGMCEPRRTLRSVVFVCATPEQVAEARTKVRRPMTPGGKVVVAAGEVAVHVWGYNVQTYGYKHDYNVFVAGEECSPPAKFLSEGESVEVTQTDHLGYNARRYIITNRNGKAEVADHPEEVAARKKFAADQIAKLCSMGYREKTAYRIMRAAGPGRAVQAAEWLKQALASTGVDALRAFLSGAVTSGLGKVRTMGAIRSLGIEPPEVSSSGALFAILRGALAALLN